MLHMLGLVCVRVLGVRVSDPERLGIFLAVLMGFMLLNLVLQPHRFWTVSTLESIGLFLMIVATYLLQFALLNTKGALAAGTSAFHAIVAVVLVLFVVFGMVLVLTIGRSAWRNYKKNVLALTSALGMVASKHIPLMTKGLSNR